MTEKTIWDLELFENFIIDRNSDVTRVPGGWIYGFCNGDVAPSTTFIPYSDDLNPASVKNRLDKIAQRNNPPCAEADFSAPNDDINRF